MAYPVVVGDPKDTDNTEMCDAIYLHGRVGAVLQYKEGAAMSDMLVTGFVYG